MKLESLAGLLGQPAIELGTALNVQEGQDLDEQIVVDKLKGFIKEIEVKNLSDGKKQGHGWAEREVKKEVVSKFVELGIQGENLEDVITNVSKVLNSKTDTTSKDALTAYKAQILELKGEIEGYKVKEATREIHNRVNEKIRSVIDQYDFATPKVKKIATDSFLQGHKFLPTDDDVLLEINGQPSADIEKYLRPHLEEFGKPIGNSRSNVPGPNGSQKTNGKQSAKELWEGFYAAKTPDEMLDWKNKIDALES